MPKSVEVKDRSLASGSSAISLGQPDFPLARNDLDKIMRIL
jgi:hypothetical protein